MKRSGVELTDSLYFPCLFSLVLLVGAILFQVSTVRGDMLPPLPPDKYCTFSTQLQKSPYREQYIARVSTTMSTMLASNSHTDSAVQSDAPTTLFGLLTGQKSTATLEPTIDEFSKECLSCHDGMTASDINFNFRNSPSTSRMQKYAGGGKDHPNGMDYQSYVVAGDGRFKPVVMFDSNMKFVDGKVGCLTCHNPLNKDRGHLAKSDQNSALCLTCHNR